MGEEFSAEFEHREILGYPDYRACDDGTIRSVHTKLNRQSWSPLRPRPVKGGYQTVALYRNGTRANHLIHRLILEAFVGPCPEGMEGCHKDHNPANNRLGNLEWGTHQYNMGQSIAAGHGIGETHSKARITEDDVREIRRLVASGVSYKELGQRYGLKTNVIGAVVYGKSWSHVTGGLLPPEELKGIIEANRRKNLSRSNTKVTAAQIAKIRSLCGEGLKLADIAARAETSIGTVQRYRIVNLRED